MRRDVRGAVPRRKIKPQGFWQRGGKGFEVTARYVRGELTEQEAVVALREAVLAASVEPREDQISDHALMADLRWYARAVRRALAQPSAYTAAQQREASPTPSRVVIGEGGRIVIPAPYRDALGVREGDELRVRLDGGELRLTTPRHALRRAQQALRRHVPADRSLADELVAERRLEAERE
ncbi:MAG: AbrB/MazE/SpoVT family DNA-binding domain-containing protein [Armatimonadota bacterium]|nr:AbrB/MazE/SpoVT family DNA-binding domain-containing protein [Armatimonadota bacterium]